MVGASFFQIGNCATTVCTISARICDQFDKPANKKQVLFSKTFLLKKSITNKPAFFIWFVKMYFYIHLLIYFHYSCIINSQKLIKSCYLCNLTSFSFSLFLFNKVIYRISAFFLHYQTSHCLKSNFSKC